MCSSVLATDLYLFCLSGQSNAYGFGGDTNLAPAPYSGVFQWTSTNAVHPLQLIKGASNGEGMGTSIVPAFGNSYRNQTGRNVGFVIGATVGSSSLLAENIVGWTNDWRPGGRLRGLVTNRYSMAKASFISAGYSVIDAGMLWVQGERDSNRIRDGEMTQADYINAFADFSGYCRSAISSTLPFYVVQIGQFTLEDDSHMKVIRDAQEIIAVTIPFTKLVSRQAVTFVTNGMMSDAIHWTQVGHNLIGTEAGRRVAAGCSCAD